MSSNNTFRRFNKCKVIHRHSFVLYFDSLILFSLLLFQQNVYIKRLTYKTVKIFFFCLKIKLTMLISFVDSVFQLFFHLSHGDLVSIEIEVEIFRNAIASLLIFLDSIKRFISGGKTCISFGQNIF